MYDREYHIVNLVCRTDLGAGTERVNVTRMLQRGNIPTLLSTLAGFWNRLACSILGLDCGVMEDSAMLSRGDGHLFYSAVHTILIFGSEAD